MNAVSRAIQSVKRLTSQPTEGLGRVQRWAIHWIDFALHCTRELKHDRASIIAASLTYRTLFSLVPVAVLALVVFRAFGGLDAMGAEVRQRIYEYLGLTSLTYEPETAAGVVAEAGADAAVGGRITGILDGLSDQIASLSFGSIGAVGIVLLIWAGLGLVVTVEDAFNRVFGSPRGRQWHVRITVYWAVLTLGPVLLSVSFYVAQLIMAQANDVPVFGSLFNFTGRFTALAASSLLLLLTYVLMPNSKVRIRPALAGAFVAASLWEVGKWGFRLYVTKALPYSALYGSLGLIPLFMLWVYITWLIILFGLEVTYTLQTMHSHQEFKAEASNREPEMVFEARLLVLIVGMIGEAFTRGQTVTASTMTRTFGIPPRGVTSMCRALESAGIIHDLSRGTDASKGFTLARPPGAIGIREILDLGRGLSGYRTDALEGPSSAYVARIAEAERAGLGDDTLADILALSEPPAPESDSNALAVELDPPRVG